MESRNPATWFVAVDGKTEGPYSIDQITKLMMDGTLNLQSQVYDPSSQSWKTAAELFPFLNLKDPAPASSGWQPPPKPTELKDVHVVETNATAPAAKADYFELVSDKTRALAERLLPSSGRFGRKPGPSRAGLFVDRSRQGSSDPADGPREKTQTGFTRSQLAAGSGPKTEASSQESPVSGEVAFEEKERGFSAAFAFFRAHFSSISLVAGLAMIFVGTYGLLRSFSASKTREPANLAKDTNARPSAAPKAAEPEAFSASPIGTGANRVARRGHLPTPVPTNSGQAIPGALSPPPPTPSAAANPEPPREPPAFYSSREEAAPVPANTEPNPVPQPPRQDANAGVVDPPSFNRAPGEEAPAPPPSDAAPSSQGSF